MEIQSRIRETKARAYTGKPFGFNVYLDKVNQVRGDDTTIVRRLLGLYFEWTEGIDDIAQRSLARRMGAFVARDLRTEGKLLISKESVYWDMYADMLPLRRKQIDTTEVRKIVCQQMAGLAGKNRAEGDETSQEV